MSASLFVSFPKIARLRREVVVTEKIDGTNAQIVIGDDGSVRAGSRTRWIVPGDDNFGFAAWVQKHADDLRALGPGQHFGEWWGSKIQRGYGLSERRFSLFNVGRWGDDVAEGARPKCCHVVPTLYRGPFTENAIDVALAGLATTGSFAAPGFDKPEGIVIFHTASGHLYKVTLENDAEPKGKAEWTAKHAATMKAVQA